MSDIRHECLWEKLTPARFEPGPLVGSAKADVCVIGGGITGLSAALRLSEQGQRVCLLEAHEIGHGGSGRNVGLVNAGTWIKPDDVEASLGERYGRRLNQLLGDSPAEVFEVIRRHGIDCQARHDGTLHMAHNGAGLDDLRDRERQWRRRGADVELLSGADCVDYCGTAKIAGALLDRRAGTINPLAYTTGLAVALNQAGAAIHTGSPVTQLVRLTGGWRVTTPNGEVEATKVLVSTGAYTEGEWNQLKGSFYRGYYYQVASRPLAGEAADGVLRHGQGSWDTRAVLSSIRRDADGRLLLGSLGRANDKPGWFIRAWADRIQQHYYPQLGKVEWELHWTGCIDFTPDHLLRLFEPAEGLLAVSGYNGRGNTTGTSIGRVLADCLLKDDPGVLPLPFSRRETLRGACLRTAFYETAFSLYHAGQCLRVVL